LLIDKVMRQRPDLDLFRTSFARLTVAVVTLAAASCGGDRGRAVPVDDLEGDLLNAECEVLVICGSVPDRATCLASVRLNSARFATLKTDVAAGTVVYDAQAAGACVDVFKNVASCKQTEMGDIQSRIDATCGKVFIGSLPAGGGCFFDEECADGGICGSQTCSSDGCCAGTCLARPTPIPVGGDCSNPLLNQECAAGTVCAANAAGGGTCKAPLPAGARCGPYDRCALPYHCGGTVDPVTNEGTCTAPPARGQSCDMSGDCDDGRDYCDPNYVCTSRIALGGACSTPEACVDYATCDGTMCVAKPGPDASCGPYPPDRCPLSLSCDTTTMHCSLPPPPPACR
jgi:hypothetical protein